MNTESAIPLNSVNWHRITLPVGNLSELEILRAFLGKPPSSTKIVVMLGNEPKYIQFCNELVLKSRNETRWVNSVAFDSNGVRFVHVTHAKAQGRLFPDWINAIGSKIQKRMDASEAVASLGLSPR